MARYPDSFIEEVKERSDLLEVIGRHVSLKKQGANWLGLCPFHGEKTPSFSVRPDQGFYKCFGCGVGGNVFNFLMKLTGMGFTEALEEMASRVGLPLPTKGGGASHQRQQGEREQQRAILDQVRQWFRQQLSADVGAPARAYLRQRGLTEDTIERFGLGYAPPGWRTLLNHFGGGKQAAQLLAQAGLVVIKEQGKGGYDRFRNRIVFPIHDHRGRCVGFGGRLLVQGTPKYINSPETLLYQKGRILYGMDRAGQAIQRAQRVVVVEGYMDVIALANHGMDAVVATLGTALTTHHLSRLWKRTKRICFCFDGDTAGKKAAWRALEQVLHGLEADRHATFLFLPDGEDPDDLVRREGLEGFRTRVEQATSLTQFLFHHLSQDLTIETPEGQAAVMHRARPLLASVSDPLLRELYGKSLGHYLGVPGRHVQERLPLSRSSPPRPRPPNLRMPPGPHAGGVYAGYTRQSEPAVAPAGRDFEQTLLVLLLRAPGLIEQYEEELGRLELDNPMFSTLLSELVNLSVTDPPLLAAGEGGMDDGVDDADTGAYAWRIDDTVQLWKRLPTAEMVACAERMLREETIDPDTVQEEFLGCLLSCQIRHLKGQIQQVRREIDTSLEGHTRQFAMLQALKQEQERLRKRKCHLVSPQDGR